MTNSTLRNSALILIAVSAICLIGIGLIVNWLAAATVAIGGALIWLGYWAAVEKLSVDRQRAKRERTALDAEWQALDRTRRVREIFFDARRAMHEEAQRYWPTDPQQGGQR